MKYHEAVRETWHHSTVSMPANIERLRELVRYATLAPSGHNTQCWRFRLSERAISILPDFSRRTPVVDPDDHHLYVSLGCAAENLSLAARALGLSGEVVYCSRGDGEISVSLNPVRADKTRLFDAIVARQCTRGDYDGMPLSRQELRSLESAGTGRGVRPVLITERDAMERVIEYVVRGNTRQLLNPAFRRELESWIRFNDREALATGDGLSARVTGNPRIPRWLGHHLLQLMLRPEPENDKVARQIRSSAGIAIFVSERDDRIHWMEVGRCYQRFALQATTLGIRNAFINQPVEESAIRPGFARAMVPGSGRADLVLRFGRGREMPKSLRRPVDSVIF